MWSLLKNNICHERQYAEKQKSYLQIQMYKNIISSIFLHIKHVSLMFWVYVCSLCEINISFLVYSTYHCLFTYNDLANMFLFSDSGHSQFCIVFPCCYLCFSLRRLFSKTRLDPHWWILLCHTVIITTAAGPLLHKRAE